MSVGGGVPPTATGFVIVLAFFEQVAPEQELRFWSAPADCCACPALTGAAPPTTAPPTAVVGCALVPPPLGTTWMTLAPGKEGLSLASAVVAFAFDG